MSDPPSPLPPDAVRSSLLAWYDESKRDLPWRRSADPYEIWISEVMLQQTRVETVVPYFRRWMSRFPTVNDVARASLDEVLGQWAGLGYYARARNVRLAARIVRERHAGRLPETLRELRALPGIGEYTAAAVASIAFGLPVPAVDGNARRVLCRLDDVSLPNGAALRAMASRLIDPERPGDSNQAIMELGSQRCTPRLPRCDSCPLERACLARRRKTVERRPARRKITAPRAVRFAVLVAVDPKGRALVARRGERGLLAGMWEFPTEEVDDGASATAAARGLAHRRTGSLASELVPLPRVPHLFSHLRATYAPYLLRTNDAPEAHGDEAGGVRWLLPAEMGRVPLPVVHKRILEEVRKAIMAEPPATPAEDDSAGPPPPSPPRTTDGRARGGG